MALTTITRLYDTHEDAVHAVTALEAAGIPHADISLVANNVDNRYPADSTMTGSTMTGSTMAGTTMADGTTLAPGATTTGTMTTGANDVDEDGKVHAGTGTGATVGTVVGGTAGLLAGIGALAIPGVGPIVAAGWLVSAITGAGVGAGVLGLLGALSHHGVAEDEAHVHVEGVRRGGSLVTVRTDETMRGTVEGILDGRAPVNLTTRRAEYETEGWAKHDPMLPALTPEQVTVERTRRGVVQVS